MTSFAGSAIKQGKGRVSSYSGRSVPTRWLLLSGAFDPPDSITISPRRTKTKSGDRSGDFLHGVTKDIDNMVQCLKDNKLQLHNMVLDLYLSKGDAKDKIRKFFEKCKQKEQKPMLYYTGHGEVGTGNWCFDDDTLSLEETLELLPGGTYFPHIFCDTCYSGHWANECAKKEGGAECLSACPEFTTALDTKSGGELTLYMIGELSRPRREPLYSEGNRSRYPIPDDYMKVEYASFLGSHMKNTKNVLIWQQICQGKFTGIFGPSKLHSPRPATSWHMTSSYKSIVEWIKDNWSSKNIYSLAFDGTSSQKYAAYLMRGYGSAQSILVGTYDVSKKWDEGKNITSCTADDSDFYLVMTKDAPGYRKEDGQRYSIKNTWKEINERIQTGYKDGMAITGLCYCSGKGQYLLVMTETPRGQFYRWFGPNEEDEENSWEGDKYSEDFHPTIKMLDPNDDKLLTVVTTDPNRSSYTTRTRYILKQTNETLQ